MHMEFGPSWKQIEVNLEILSKMTEFYSLSEVCLWVTLHLLIIANWNFYTR